jgi:hypothetical protein
VTFSAEHVAQLRRAAWDAWMHDVASDTPDGWSLSPADPGRMVAAVGLELAPGRTLRGYQHREDRDGSGIVYALPADAAPWPPEGDPPLPPRARPAMSAVQIDGSPESFLAASVLSRELEEFGAVGHGVRWLAETVLDSDPWHATVDFLGPVKEASERDQWTWEAPEPDTWAPQVWIEDSRATVQLHTFTALGGEAIVRHEDTYLAGRLAGSTHVVVARGPGGFVL